MTNRPAIPGRCGIVTTARQTKDGGKQCTLETALKSSHSSSLNPHPSAGYTQAIMLSPEPAEALARGAHILTCSQRAARALTRAYAEQARASGLRGWRAPAIQDWSCRIEELYATLAQVHPELPPLLNPLQEELLWKRVQEDDAAAVVSPESLARLAQSAYALLSAYEAHSYRRAPWAAAHEDAERFLNWASAYDALCGELAVRSRCRIADDLRLHAAELPAPPELYLIGFDRLTPEQSSLLQAWETAGTRVTYASLNEPASDRRLFCAFDEQEELRACAQWARARLEQQPDLSIGIFLGDVQGQRAEIDRNLRRVFPDVLAAPSYEFSGGVSLSSIPLIAAAVLVLRWQAGALAAAEVSSLLLGGFLASSPEEHLALAQADAALRERGLLTTELALTTLLRHAEKRPGLLPPQFTERLRAASEWARTATKARSYQEWAEAVPTLLATLGWPGSRELSSVSFQARECWEALVERAGSLAFAGGAVRRREFVNELASAAAHETFAAESLDAPIQIMSVSEAAGLTFDAVWFLGANEGRWPANGRLHPLLAPGVQRDAGMPHTDPQADSALAQTQLRRVLASAPEVVISYARQLGGSPARPSPLLAAWNIEAEPVEAPRPQRPVETVREPEVAAGPAWLGERPAGGSETLKYQAACAFQAFAAKRLGAAPVENEAWGLNPADRATLLHRALERLWSANPGEPGRLHTLADLRQAMADSSLHPKLRDAIQGAFAGPLREAAGDPWRTAYLELEQRRLHTRLSRWLLVEAERTPFAVAALEQRIEGVAVGPLRLNLRVDRIDRLDDGRALLLDYKTADRISPTLWQGARLEEPQLPIYAIFGGIPDVGDIAFAQIRPGKGKTRLQPYVGDNGGALPREEWTEALTALAHEFARGAAHVKPARGDATCRVCGLYGVCRIRTQADAPDAAEEGEADA